MRTRKYTTWVTKYNRNIYSIERSIYNLGNREKIGRIKRREPETGYKRNCYDDQWLLLRRFQVVAAVTTARQ